MVFKNKTELLNFLYNKAYDALRDAQSVVYEIIHDFIRQFYADYYPPEIYERTEQLLRSLVKGDIRPSAKGFVADVYFDLDYIYATGNHPTGEQVMKAAAQGLHGAIGENFLYVHGDTGVGIWNDPLQVLDAEAIRILRDRLIEQGIPIKKR